MKRAVVLIIFAIVSTTSCHRQNKLENLTTLKGRQFPVNPKIDPCDNFYEYACSNVISSFNLRPDRVRHVFSFSDSNERLLKIRKNYFKSLAKAEPADVKEEQIKNFFMACTDIGANKKDELAHVKRLLAEMDSVKDKKRMLSFLAESIISPYDVPIYISNLPNLKDPTRFDIAFGSSAMSLPEKTYYQNPELMKDFEALVVRFFAAIGFKDAQERANQVISFEKRLAKVYPFPAEMRKRIRQDNRRPRAEILRSYPNLHLEKPIGKIPKKIDIRDYMPEVLKFMNDYLGKATLAEVKNIFMYRNIRGYLDVAYPKYRAAAVKFSHKHLGGPVKRPERVEECSMGVMHSFSKEVDAILWPRLFPDFPREKVIRLSEKVRKAHMDHLNKNKWLSAPAKKAAIKKMKTAKLQLVSPMTPKEWDFKPDGNYHPKRPVQNDFELSRVHLKKFLEDLKKPTNSNAWGMAPLTVNAYYSPSFNKFVMPIGILQYPFFVSDGTDTVNLGGVGVVIGHELGHAIDDQGSKFDYRGRQRQWMSAADLKEFKRRSRKMIKQFDDIGHNGDLTLGENVADLVGVTAAYDAAFPGGIGTKTEKRQFFLQYARIWCEVDRPKNRENRLKTDPHSLGFARVNEQVKHQPGFQEAFQCKEGDAMVLSGKDRVSIW